MRRTRARPAPPVERDWSEPRAKVERERVCRLGGLPDAGCAGPVQAAHVIGRARADEPHPDLPGRLIVRAVDVVPLCRRHHEAYDRRELDLLPHLTEPEQVRAVQVAGGILSALVRVSGRRAANPTPEVP
jgi:hypothetical protein